VLWRKVNFRFRAGDDTGHALHVKLMSAENARIEAEREVQCMRRAMDIMRSDLEQKIRITAEDGCLRVKFLEETVQRLSKRGMLEMKVAQLSFELSEALRAAARARSDLMFAHDRIEALTRELESSHPLSIEHRGQQGVGAQRLGPLDSQIVDRPSAPHAKGGGGDDLSELLLQLRSRAEVAEVALGEARSELQSLRNHSPPSKIDESAFQSDTEPSKVRYHRNLRRIYAWVGQWIAAMFRSSPLCQTSFQIGYFCTKNILLSSSTLHCG
jgi:hypothetical protein